ncbi:MAG: hypothetical protein AAGA20_00230 [Planctomycetota bacterium]
MADPRKRPERALPEMIFLIGVASAFVGVALRMDDVPILIVLAVQGVIAGLAAARLNRGGGSGVRWMAVAGLGLLLSRVFC